MKYAFFTGATGGLGLPCVKQMSESARWTIFAAGTNEEKLKYLGSLPNVIPVKVDITSQESVEAARDFVSARTKKLDALVNFAGMTAFTPAVEGDAIAATSRLLEVNVMGMVRVNRVFFDMIFVSGGRIVNCSSEAGWMTSQPFAAPYFLSNHAVDAYSDSLRRELMFLGIPVIKIQPGAFRTNMTDQVFAGYERTMESSKYFQDILNRMKPLMLQELAHNPDIKKLTRVLLMALESRRPKIRYRVGTGKLLALMELLPEGVVDRVYRLYFKNGTFGNSKVKAL